MPPFSLCDSRKVAHEFALAMVEFSSVPQKPTVKISVQLGCNRFGVGALRPGTRCARALHSILSCQQSGVEQATRETSGLIIEFGAPDASSIAA